jgi:hypothetical protein
MLSTIRLLFLASALCFAADHARAQCATIPATGCPGQAAVFCGTPPQIGTNFIWRCAPTCFGGNFQQFIVIGFPFATPVNLFPPLTCFAAGCGLGCNPVLVQPAPGATMAIPNNNTLIGFMFCIQCLCFDPTVPCFSMTQAVKVTIM